MTFKSDFERKLNRDIAAVPKEIKQKVLDLIWSGKNIGEIKKIVNLDTLVVGGIITENIESAYYLRKEVKEV